MSYKLGTRSLQNLSGVHPDLVAVVKLAITKTTQDFTVIEGVRNINRQRELVKKGASTTMNSRHITGHAVDMVPWPVDWEDLERFEVMSEAMKTAAEELDIPIKWGGDWKSFYDAPHFELDRKTYP
ncbi:M15 family metallopeptidase [bacterium]|nr:M15 family metallopeptidase [bacterium]MDB4277764.1 M15 family metallopeptidase [Gammaproteobacteria bacterium]MDB4352808.1 M15 family metallopeptidase [Porticoccaceae bacterium]MDB9844230.1 M15 family metallopeptidase [Porticoccaceae bacterium]